MLGIYQLEMSVGRGRERHLNVAALERTDKWVQSPKSIFGILTEAFRLYREGAEVYVGEEACIGISFGQTVVYLIIVSELVRWGLLMIRNLLLPEGVNLNRVIRMFIDQSYHPRGQGGGRDSGGKG
jgi:hypothetical protein